MYIVGVSVSVGVHLLEFTCCEYNNRPTESCCGPNILMVCIDVTAAMLEV